MNIGPRGNPMPLCAWISRVIAFFGTNICNYNLMKFTYNLLHVLLQLWQDKDVTLNPGGYNPKTLAKEVGHHLNLDEARLQLKSEVKSTWQYGRTSWFVHLHSSYLHSSHCLFLLEVRLALNFFNRALSCDVITFKITKENRKQPPYWCTMR